MIEKNIVTQKRIVIPTLSLSSSFNDLINNNLNWSIQLEKNFPVFGPVYSYSSSCIKSITVILSKFKSFSILNFDSFKVSSDVVSKDIKSRILSMECAEENAMAFAGLLQFIYDYQPLEFKKETSNLDINSLYLKKFSKVTLFVLDKHNY